METAALWSAQSSKLRRTLSSCPMDRAVLFCATGNNNEGQGSALRTDSPSVAGRPPDLADEAIKQAHVGAAAVQAVVQKQGKHLRLQKVRKEGLQPTEEKKERAGVSLRGALQTTMTALHVRGCWPAAQ